MRRSPTLLLPLFVVAIGLLAVVARWAPGDFAGDTNPAPAAHPLVGTWLLSFPEVRDQGDRSGHRGPRSSLYTFGADGTVVGTEYRLRARQGTWSATGDRTAAFLAAFQATDTTTTTTTETRTVDQDGGGLS